jgi:hypothetical protein
MSRPTKWQAALAALILSATLPSCETIPGLALPEAEGEPRAKTTLTKEQAAQKFFQAYKSHNRLAAAQVATPEAIRKLNWNPLAGSASNVQLQENDEGDYVITYDGGAIHLQIFGDGHVGHTVSDVRISVD